MIILVYKETYIFYKETCIVFRVNPVAYWQLYLFCALLARRLRARRCLRGACMSPLDFSSHLKWTNRYRRSVWAEGRGDAAFYRKARAAHARIRIPTHGAWELVSVFVFKVWYFWYY
jgi:hypothetical protein